MPVAAPPRPPAQADTLEALREQALIKEARQRARRRHQRYAAAVAIATAIVGLGASFAMRPDNGGVRPSAAAHPLAPAAASARRSTIVFAIWHRNITATLYSINADGTGLHRLLSKSAAKLAGHRPSWPALSPDGHQVAYQTGIEPRTAIDVVNLNGTNLRQIALGGRPTWSPDGTKIAYEFPYSRTPPGAYEPDVYVIHADRTAPHRLARWAWRPAWSPDGTKLAYTCVTPQTGDAHLCVMNADGTGRHRIAAVAADSTPAWSPDGTKIAFLGYKMIYVPGYPKIAANGTPQVRVYVINANGTNLRRLTPLVSFKNQDCGPVWSPSGKQIAFSPTDPIMDGTIGGIYLMNPDGRHVVHLKGTTGFTCGISWQRTPA